MKCAAQPVVSVNKCNTTTLPCAARPTRGNAGCLRLSHTRRPALLAMRVLRDILELALAVKILAVEVSGFVPHAAPHLLGRGISSGLASKPGGSTVQRCSRRPATASISVAGDTIDTLSDVPTVIVAFGFTQEQRLTAEAVFRDANLFSDGVHVVGATKAGVTLRELLMSSPGRVEELPDRSTGPSSISLEVATTLLAGESFSPKVLFVLSHMGRSQIDGDTGSRDDAAIPYHEDAEIVTTGMMNALDACGTVPPAIISTPPLNARTKKGPQRTLIDLFDESLLDTPLADLQRQEIRRHAKENCLAVPLKVHDTAWGPPEKEIDVAMNLELDGAWVSSTTAPGQQRWDTSKVVVIDGLVDKDLCRDLLDLVTEPGWVTATTNNLSKTRAEPADAHSECNSKYHVGMQPSSAKEGPPTTKWERGLTDVDTDEAGGSTAAPGTGSWGLTNEAMEWLCQDGEHPAIVEVQSRLCKLYPDVDILHMPEAVMGPSTPRMVANAPVYGDQFSWHIDADPMMVPPSPWRDHFGTYTNREPGMPLFATLLVYLDAEWLREWDAETLFLDAPTGTGMFVRPRGGRAVMMDQDVTHRISAPSQTAARPRYSLVWKLIFSARGGRRQQQHDMPNTAIASDSEVTAGTKGAQATEAAEAALGAVDGIPSIALPEWGEPVRFGSAARGRRPDRASIRNGGQESVQREGISPVHAADSTPTADGDRNDGFSEGATSTAHARSDYRSGSDIDVAADVSAGDASEDNVNGADRVADLVGTDKDTCQSKPPSRGDGADTELSPLLEVRPVGMKGMGVFSVRPINQGEIVAFYSGEVLSTVELDERYPGFEGSEYVMQIGPDQFLDAQDADQSGIARYVNHSNMSPNLAVEMRRVTPPTTGTLEKNDNHGSESNTEGEERVALTALRDIPPGEELTFDYGDEYFDGEDDAGSVIEDGKDMLELLGDVDWGSNSVSA